MEKIKVIHISHASVSVYMKGQKTLKQMILDDWYSLTAQQIKKYYPEIDIECWTPEKSFKIPQEFFENGIKYRQFPTLFSPMYGLDFSIKMLKEMKKEILSAKENRYKVVFHLHEYHNLHGLLIASLFKGEKIIGQHHGGSWPLKHLVESKKKKYFFLFFLWGQIWENIVLRNIDYFYALSKDEINYLKQVAPKSKIKFQTMGIEEYYFKEVDKKMARKKLAWEVDKKIVLYLGRLIPVKGLDYLLRAMKKIPEVELKVIGWGDEKFYKNYAKNLGLKNVEFVGPIFYEKKLSYLSASDVFVLPSIKEGAPVSLMEAMAMNVPSVVTDVGGTTLMIKNGENGVIVDRNVDSIIMGIKKVLKWTKKDIRKYAEKYKWEEVVRESVKDYKSLFFLTKLTKS